MEKLNEAITSVAEVEPLEQNIYQAPISIEELHEFLTFDEEEEKTDTYELRKVYA